MELHITTSITNSSNPEANIVIQEIQIRDLLFIMEIMNANYIIIVVGAN